MKKPIKYRYFYIGVSIEPFLVENVFYCVPGLKKSKRRDVNSCLRGRRGVFVRFYLYWNVSLKQSGIVTWGETDFDLFFLFFFLLIYLFT